MLWRDHGVAGRRKEVWKLLFTYNNLYNHNRRTIMEKALNFLQQHLNVAFATVEEGDPKLRVFEIMKIKGEELFFATSPSKEVYRQLTANPHAEILAMEGNVFVRVSGKVRFDVGDEVGREIYLSNSVLQRLYERYTDLVYFRLPIESLDYYDLSSDPVVSGHYPETDGNVR